MKYLQSTDELPMGSVHALGGQIFGVRKTIQILKM